MFTLGMCIGLCSGVVLTLVGVFLGYRCAQAWNRQDDDAATGE